MGQLLPLSSCIAQISLRNRASAPATTVCSSCGWSGTWDAQSLGTWPSGAGLLVTDQCPPPELSGTAIASGSCLPGDYQPGLGLDGAKGSGRRWVDGTGWGSLALLSADEELYAGVYIDFMGTDAAIFRTMGKQTAMRTDQYNSRWLNGELVCHWPKFSGNPMASALEMRPIVSCCILLPGHRQ